MLKDMSQFADWFDEHLKKTDQRKQDNPSANAKADRPPRKVVIGTAIFGPFGTYRASTSG